MMKPIVICILTSAQAFAQFVSPTIHLTANEAAEARQSSNALKSVQDRRNVALIEWKTFRESFETTHPDLAPVTFSSDFSFAFKVLSNSPTDSRSAMALSLTMNEQQKGQAFYAEVTASETALRSAEKSWSDYQYEIIARHVQPNGAGQMFTLASGATVTIPNPWNSGVAFTPDFQAAVPRSATRN